MKKAVLMALVALFMYANHAAAQQTQDTTKYLLKLGKPHSYGLYVSPEFQYGQVKNAFTTFAGSSVMFLVNQKFAMGATFQESTDNTFSPTGISPLVLRSGFGGLKMEFITGPSKAVHFTFPLVLGLGQASADSASFVNPKNNDWDLGEHGGHGGKGGDFLSGEGNEYFVIQPGIQVEANLIRHIKLYAGANYRYAGALTTTNTATIPLAASTLQGVSFNVGAKIGFFNFQPSKIKRPHFRFGKKHRQENN